MKTAALQALRQKLSAGQPALGFWVTLESPSVTEAAVALGFDWVVIDAEHGHLDFKEILEHVRATVRSNTVALVRVQQRDTGIIKRILDLGADGIVVPWIESAEQFLEAWRDSQYPPQGRRGIGGERATVWGECLADHTAEANAHLLVVPLIETPKGAACVPDLVRLPEAEVFFFGPADFSSNAGYRGQWEGPGVAESILECARIMAAARKPYGVMATSADDLQRRLGQGFQLLGLASDMGLVLRGLHEMLRAAGRNRRAAPSLAPDDGRPLADPLPQPPPQYRPDRTERMTAVGAGQRVELQRGVICEMLVGEFNTARHLTTAIVEFAPGAELDPHAHPCSESITVLSGELEVAVEGRTYRLGPLDNITIPRWFPHRAANRSVETPARLHVALAASVPGRSPAEWPFARIDISDDGSSGDEGRPGAERLTRYATARRTFGVGPGAEFIDFFNADLVPGIEMSGGYGRFEPGGRLPAHLHDFDESICIISGTADCRVEGRRYSLGGCATAMVPRGRVHYFVNTTDAPMEMIWVYAGPRPERIVIAESWAEPPEPPAET